MQTSTRRTFMMKAITGTAVLSATAWAAAEEEEVTEADPYARSMGFKVDTKTVDQAKYPRHDAATQQCNKCQLYSGKPGDALGPCSFFGGRLVSPNGWCRNFKVIKA